MLNVREGVKNEKSTRESVIHGYYGGGGPLYIEFFPSKSGKKDVLHCLGNGKICYL